VFQHGGEFPDAPVAEGSIRERILKPLFLELTTFPISASCRGLDPREDTETNLKGGERGWTCWLQRARSERGY